MTSAMPETKSCRMGLVRQTKLLSMRTDYRIGDWNISPRRGCIERGDEIVHVNPRPLAVLECLADAQGEVVTRDELFDAVWPGVIVTDDALTQCVVELRRAFGDSASDPQVIKTVPKVGFCLLAPVSPLTDESAEMPETAGKAGPLANRNRASLLIACTVFLVVILLWYLADPGVRKRWIRWMNYPRSPCCPSST